MRIRITRTPDAAEFVEFDVRRFHVGEVCDVTPQLATLLIVAGNAEPVLTPSVEWEAADRSQPIRRSKKDPQQFS